MVEVSRDGRRVYLTNSLYAVVGRAVLPGGHRRLDDQARRGRGRQRSTVDPDFFVPFTGERPHQVRLEGGDASSDSYCFPI